MTQLTAPSPDDANALVALFQRGPLDAFLARAHAYGAAWPDNAEAQDLLGALYAAIGRFDLAEPALAVAARAKQDDTQAQLVHGAALQQLERHESALDALARAAAAAPAGSSLRLEADHLTGLSLHALDRFAEAAEVLERVVAADPQNVRARNNHAISLQALGRADESVDTLRAALAFEPGYVEALSNLATGLEMRGQIAEAEAALRRAAALSPQDASLPEKLGGLLLEAGDLDAAEDVLEQALALDSGRLDALNSLGMVQHRKGNLGRAVACYEVALTQAEGRPELQATLHANRAYALMDAEELEAAIAGLEASLALDGESDFNRAQKINLQMQTGDWRALDEFAAHADRLGLDNAPVSPGSLLAIDDDPARQLARAKLYARKWHVRTCLLYTSDAADDKARVDL
ncbi:tetratricopeptide repeat protein, partial [Novosphingobium sp.]|uniref:tetratricopeptide repeat protein n=1 Tax=Novosphingobium sp. TaxID=1874826 RepID=UPI0038BB8BE2